jgi:DNA-binding XRE family transcriptional regulator
MRISETGDVIEIPAIEEVIEIPWDRIRSIADLRFCAQRAVKAAECRNRMCKRIQAMRLEAGLTRLVLGNRVGVLRETVANLDNGRITPSPALIEKIVVGLGRPLANISEEP